MPEITSNVYNSLRASENPPLVVPPAISASLTLPPEMNFLEQGLGPRETAERARSYFDKQLAQLPASDASRSNLLKYVDALAASGRLETLAFLAQSVSALGPLRDTMQQWSSTPSEISKVVDTRLQIIRDISSLYASTLNDARTGIVLPHIQQEIEQAGQQFVQALTHPQSEPLNSASARLDGYNSYTRYQGDALQHGIGTGTGEIGRTLDNLLMAARMGDEARVARHGLEFTLLWSKIVLP